MSDTTNVVRNVNNQLNRKMGFRLMRGIPSYSLGHMGSMKSSDNGKWHKSQDVADAISMSNERIATGFRTLEWDKSRMHCDEIQNMTDNHAEALEALAAKNEADNKNKDNELTTLRDALKETKTQLRSAKTKKTMAVRFAILVTVYAVAMNVLFVSGVLS